MCTVSSVINPSYNQSSSSEILIRNHISELFLKFFVNLCKRGVLIKHAHICIINKIYNSNCCFFLVLFALVFKFLKRNFQTMCQTIIPLLFNQEKILQSVFKTFFSPNKTSNVNQQLFKHLRKFYLLHSCKQNT